MKMQREREWTWLKRCFGPLSVWMHQATFNNIGQDCRNLIRRNFLAIVCRLFSFSCLNYSSFVRSTEQIVQKQRLLKKKNKIHTTAHQMLHRRFVVQLIHYLWFCNILRRFRCLGFWWNASFSTVIQIKRMKFFHILFNSFINIYSCSPPNPIRYVEIR